MAVTIRVLSDAGLALDVAQIREFVGAADGDTAPLLTNTAGEYVFSGLVDPLDSDLEEVVNILNQEMGDRSYTGSILTNGETVATSLQALSDASGGAQQLLDTIVTDSESGNVVTDSVTGNVVHTL